MKTIIATLSMATLLSGCAYLRNPFAPPNPAPAPTSKSAIDRSYVVLLDNGDGTTGTVSVTGPGGVTVLDTAPSATMISGPLGNRYPVDEATVKADFAAAVAATPRRPVTYRLYFEPSSARLTASSRAELPRVLEELVRRPAPDISVVGHTDTVGDADANLALGLSRARSVVDLLGAQSQVPADRIFIESHGEMNPLVSTPDNFGEPRNRRVEVTIR